MSVAGPTPIMPPSGCPPKRSRLDASRRTCNFLVPMAKSRFVNQRSSKTRKNLLNRAAHERVERVMGDTEASYFLPSRDDGVNDMYLHLGCRASPRLFERERVRLVWALLRVRHPLLAARVEMKSYADVRFVYELPRSKQDALNDAEKTLEYRTQSKDELLDAYLNGPRTLSQDRLSYLIISCESGNAASKHSSDVALDYEVFICAAHFIGDGMALHQFANDFFCLLGGPSTNQELASTLLVEWQKHCDKSRNKEIKLPSPLEDRLPSSQGRLSQVVAQVDFVKSQEKLIGGHTFPRQSTGPRRTVTPVISLDAETTKKILKRCKSNGVSISSALFSLCNIAWIKTSGQQPEIPMMMYSALNLRPYLLAGTAISDSYWYLAVGYFNVILPSFLRQSGGIAGTFWQRARSAKQQTAHAAKNPMTVSRSREMARKRGSQARAWAKEDDDKANGVWVAPPPKKRLEGPPSSALIGLSLLGNLDATYKHPSFGDICLHTLTTGSRQRAGAMLLFGYTFAGKLWVSLGYDENGFETDVVERFWRNLSASIDELLIN